MTVEETQVLEEKNTDHSKQYPSYNDNGRDMSDSEVTYLSILLIKRRG
jgi:hypothetical protein